LFFGPRRFSKIQDGQAVLFLSHSSDPQSAGRTKLVHCLRIRQNSAVVVVHCAKLTIASEQDSEVVDLTEAGDPAQPEQKRSKTITSYFSAYDPNNAEHVAAKEARERREAERALDALVNSPRASTNDMGRTLPLLFLHSSHLPRYARTCIVYCLSLRQNRGASDGTWPKFCHIWARTDGTLTNVCISYGMHMNA
jgi:hypothetical protein